MFQLLNDCGVQTAFIDQTGDTEFRALKTKMIPLEVVARREAYGSFLKRMPHLKERQLFPRLLVEFFLKTTDRRWEDTDLPCDDPFMEVRDDGKAYLYLPKTPFYAQEPFAVLDDYPLKDRPECLKEIEEITRKVFLILEKQWALLDKTLVDFKLEFGFTDDGRVVLSDVVDNDSWRLFDGAEHLDKQVYRDGGELGEVARKYQTVAELTKRFGLPEQQLILWRASANDDLEPFFEAFRSFDACGAVISVVKVTRSLHKQPEKALEELRSIIRQAADSVLIVFCGRSNGAGPTLSAHVPIPTITVPASLSFPEDVWSSLRTPSDVPVATILEPKNAVLAALQSLALRSPLVWAELQYKLEERLS